LEFVAGTDPLRGIVQFKALVNDVLHSPRAGFDTKENAAAARFSHERDQFFVNTICTCAGSPVKFFLALQQGFAKCHYSFTVDRKHVVHQLKRVDAVCLLDPAHIGNHLRRTFQPEIATKKIVGRTERAGKGAAAPQFQGKVAAEANVGKKMKSRKW